MLNSIDLIVVAVPPYIGHTLTLFLPIALKVPNLRHLDDRPDALPAHYKIAEWRSCWE